MKLSVSTYSFNQYIKQGKMTQLDAVSKAKEMGFDGIDFTELMPKNEKGASFEEQLAYAKELRAEAERVGIEVVAYMTGAKLYSGNTEADEAEIERIKRQLDVAAELGVKVLRHDVCSSEKVGERVVSFGKMLPVIAENVRQIADYAASLGIRTCSENHGYVAQDSDRVETLYNTVDHDNYGVLVDIGNFACADEDSIRAVSRLAPYAIHVHAKDFHILPYGTTEKEGEKFFMTRGCRRLVGCAVGDGDIPVKQCLDILKRAGYDGWVTIEFEGNNDCVEEIAKGLERLKEYIA